MNKTRLPREQRLPLAFLEYLPCYLDHANGNFADNMRRSFATQDHEEVISVMSSKRRLKVLCSLTEGPLTQKHIHRHTGIPLANLGRVLDEMKGGEIVISRTRQMRKFKTYGLTSRGKTVQDYLIALVWAKREGGALTPLEEQLYSILEEVLDESAQASRFGTWR